LLDRYNNTREFLRVIDKLLLIRKGTPALRKRLRQRVGFARLGELSALLKAISSDEELTEISEWAEDEQIRITGIRSTTLFKN